MLGRRHAEWVAWLRLYELEPFGPHHDDWRWATLTASVYRAAGVKADPRSFLHGRRPAKPRADGSRSWLRSTAPAYRG